ncbi:replication initiator [Dactylosporangium aurantiacum]|uniref:replication initiator n=1 Tax=Dactylosporangium aurantiacum TaxID=35754 RepID=UPI00367D0C2B
MTPEPAALALLARSTDIRDQAIARAARPDYPAWVSHVRAASGCTRPVRLAGTMTTIEAATGRLLDSVDTAHMPDGVIYKACGNRRESVCPSCSETYKRDAYQVVRAGLVGGKGVPEHVAQHPAVFPTFTAPSFGEVHTRVVKRHTCGKRPGCDCRPEPCHARRDVAVCPHGRRIVCFARHEATDKALGTPMCLDCYDHAAQVVWNLQAGELWRRTGEAIRKYIRRVARQRGIDPDRVRLAKGKAAEMQRRGVIHFHAIIRLDGADPDDKTAILPPPPGLDAQDLVDAVEYAARTAFTTDPHPANPDGWRIGWGEQLLTKVITTAADGDVTDGMVAAYLAKYATKATEVTGHASNRLTDATVSLYADPDGTHTERLIEACWTLGTPRDWRGLRRWAHMLGFGGHFFTKSRTYSVTFAVLRQRRIVHRRTETSGPAGDGQVAEQPTTLVVNFLQFVGAGWLSPADAMLATTSAAMAREHQQQAREYLSSTAA